ncbi:hypothetical protein DDB_G0276165 [Dictyostelium discoideum AX4]|uniref:Uncharacterized protein DDB_G0276165 n=1 Tax=Dictyostelium discoideum TaxID=44689 RepID=Y6165_DICDI|nr:hypothetical protein DDB_G0276165 [Dictyostelium discoideum AX4]Q86IA1.2 RecName: Full=Uncharacterized protein DDB_G0276165 [Dictyostelium discoideum]EAS66913.1 hypothetical protein DDB_G0276165 [Dictyostelium discoideum AX4]|eukprot:XP_001134597.1 hypothetical protein DDB_G0276165 [Dictyostelium discoideum AX4]
MTILKSISSMGISNRKNSFSFVSTNSMIETNQNVNSVSKSGYSKLIKGAALMAEGISGFF